MISNRPYLKPFQFKSIQIYRKIGFLTDLDTEHENAFKEAIDTCYEGFSVDPPSCIKGSNLDDKVQKGLKFMEEVGIFRYDITQPFGLGTKCAKTFVRRCLVGEEGTTYR